MAENEGSANEGQGAAAQPQQQTQQTPQVKILAHFVRDLSFENVGAVQGTPAQGQPDISVSVHLDGSRVREETYQLAMKITAKATTGDKTRFLAELDYGGIFSIQNAPETHIHPILMIECPRLLWPFARRVVADVTRDGGYPSLLLDNIDFAQLYRQRLEEMRRQQAEGAGQQGGGDEAAAPGGNGPEGGAAEGGAPEGQKPH